MFKFNKHVKTLQIDLYRKVPKFWDAKKICCNIPKIQTKRPNLWVFCQNNANRIANSEDPDQTVLEHSDLGLHCFLRPICPKNLGSLQYFFFFHCSPLLLVW